MASYDAIVIGTGQAGVPLATKLADAGKRVLIAERGAPGGTCINTGCTPTKTLIASARAAHVARSAARLGVQTGPVRVDFAKVIARKDAIVKEWGDGIAQRLSGYGENLTFVRGHARFVGPKEVEVLGERHQADTIVINVGGRAVVPSLAGLGEVPFLDNATALGLRELPPKLIVLGGGYIGVELAQLFRRFGSEVTIVDPGAHLMGREDEDVSSALEEVFRKEGIVLELGQPAKSVAKTADGVALTLASGKVISGSHLLVATGRRPNTDDLGCDKAGITLDARGYVEVNDQYRSSVPGVYAVGDATAQPQFTHTSWDDHRLLFDLLMGKGTKGRSSRLIPYACFTDPQVAGVGLNEKEAKKKNVAHELVTMSFGEIARAIEVDEPSGVLKLLVDPKTEKILGANIVGIEAGELIHVFAALMRADASIRALVEMETVHPTLAEGLQALAMKLKPFAVA